MNRFQTACQIWSVLAWAARNRQTLTYMQLARLTGANVTGLAAQLEPIQCYCLEKEFPPLTSIVVKQETGLPGSGFNGATAADLGRAQAAVYGKDWLGVGNPGWEELERTTAARSPIGMARVESGT